MTLKRVEMYGTYDESKSDTDIDRFRQKKCEDWFNNGMTGTFIAGEGNSWIRLEGDENDLDAEVHDLLGDDFFDNLIEDRQELISSKSLDEVYTYYEDYPPITSLD